MYYIIHDDEFVSADAASPKDAAELVMSCPVEYADGPIRVYRKIGTDLVHIASFATAASRRDIWQRRQEALDQGRRMEEAASNYAIRRR